MVIFKFIILDIKNASFILFTFQYGDIQMRFKRFSEFHYSNNLHSNMVIFKFRYKNKSLADYMIYIPIWWYSNLGGKELAKSVTVTIYIPIWWYSNPGKALLICSYFRFTFQYGDIQIDLSLR